MFCGREQPRLISTVRGRTCLSMRKTFLVFLFFVFFLLRWNVILLRFDRLVSVSRHHPMKIKVLWGIRHFGWTRLFFFPLLFYSSLYHEWVMLNLKLSETFVGNIAWWSKVEIKSPSMRTDTAHTRHFYIINVQRFQTQIITNWVVAMGWRVLACLQFVILVTLLREKKHEHETYYH